MKLAVVIPTFNRREALRGCLNSLLGQSLPADQFEIIVVVDGSTDGTLEMLRTFSGVFRLVVLTQANRGQTAALNAGARAASADIVLFLDDDLVCDPELLASHLAMHRHNPGGLVFGKMHSLLSERPGAEELLFHSTWLAQYARLAADPEPLWPDDAWTGPNCSLSRAAFLEIGGYDEIEFPRRGEDVDLGLRLWQSGVPFRYAANAVTSHRWQKPITHSVRDDVEDGASEVRICRRYPAMRSRSPLAGIFHAPAWKRGAARALSTFSAPLTALFAISIGALETTGRVWVRTAAIRLLRLRRTLALLAGARREAGGWHQLRGLFGERVSVLLYHHIGAPKPGTAHLSLTITPSQFRRQMMWLRLRGYSPISAVHYLDWLRYAKPLPKKPLILTFDDAYADNATHAYPVLERAGFPGIVFAITGLTGGNTMWDGLPMMSLQDLRDWSARGIEVGAHTKTHPELPALSDRSIEDEVEGSKLDLLNAGFVAVSFAYPYGCFDARARHSVGSHFALAFTCEEGRNELRTDPLLLHRTMVQPGDTLLDIELRAALGWSPFNRLRGAIRLRTRVRLVLSALRLARS